MDRRAFSAPDVRIAVGATAPVDLDDISFIAIDTSTPYMNEFNPAQGGSMSHWVARWVNTRGETGPWSDVVSATVPGNRFMGGGAPRPRPA